MSSGDLVEIVVARPEDDFEVGARMRVYYVGDDGTLDVGLESLVDDYVMHTVELRHVRRCPAIGARFRDVLARQWRSVDNTSGASRSVYSHVS